MTEQTSPRLLLPYTVPNPGDRRPSRAALVPKIRTAVDQWRAEGYPGVTATTKRLLQYWFENEHKRGGGEFSYYFCQREAVETLIYLSEVRGLGTLFDMARAFPPDDDASGHARYVFKMATGSGKTIVMGLAVVWAYLNAVLEPSMAAMPRAFLVVAPNVIVYERLKSDFEDGRIFRDYPMTPPELQSQWQMTVVLRDNPAQPSTTGALYLTNIQRLYVAPADRAASYEPGAMTAMLGPRVRAAAPLTGAALRGLIARHPRLMVLNDEGHHLHNDELEWAQVINRLHEGAAEQGGVVVAQLDFTATPKHTNGALFREIVVDYPLAQAVADGIVKRPILGELTGAVEQDSPNPAIRYRDRLTAGIAKWREFRDRWEGEGAEAAFRGRKPVLFVMAESTKAADKIAEWLEGQPDFAGRVLTIHTNTRGEITEGASNLKDIERLREAARRVDSDDNPYHAIVSVLMLREGWDVKNVVVIVPLRPYTAAAKILPEQTLGRGLRRMSLPGSGFDEQVIVIEHEAFREFWRGEVEETGEIPSVPVGQVAPNFVAIYVDPTKVADYDIGVPLLTPSLAISGGLEGMTLDEVDRHVIQPAPHPSLLKDDTFTYTGIEMRTLEVVERHEIERAYPADPGGYVEVLCDLIQRECRITGQFHILAGLVKAYIEDVLFGEHFSMEEEHVLRRLNQGDAQNVLFEVFVRAIRQRSIEQRQVRGTGEVWRVSQTSGFEWTESGHRQVYAGRKTVFNYVACDNGFEADFARFLDAAEDVFAYAKNPVHVGFALDYLNSQGALRHYYPDFIVRCGNGVHYLAETKGQEDIEVQHKDARAQQWCRDAEMITGTPWRYLKVRQSLFAQHSFARLEELVASAHATP